MDAHTQLEQEALAYYMADLGGHVEAIPAQNYQPDTDEKIQWTIWRWVQWELEKVALTNTYRKRLHEIETQQKWWLSRFKPWWRRWVESRLSRGVRSVVAPSGARLGFEKQNTVLDTTMRPVAGDPMFETFRQWAHVHHVDAIKTTYEIRKIPLNEYTFGVKERDPVNGMMLVVHPGSGIAPPGFVIVPEHDDFYIRLLLPGGTSGQS